MLSRWFTMLASTLLLVTLTAGCKNSPPLSVVAITLSPDAVTLVPGQAQEFVAVVSGSSDSSVTWSVTGGTLVRSGNTVTYTAPAAAGAHVLTAVSNADASKLATAAITVAAGGDVVAITLSPAAVTLAPGQAQEFVATVTGAVDTSVTWSVTGGTLAGSGNTVTYTAPAVAGGHVLTATSNADASKRAMAAITVSPGTVAVVVSPATVTLVPGQTQAFVATVTGSADTSVTWSVTGGTLVGSGNTVTYMAPAVVGGYVLTATSMADASRKGTASITVSAPPDPFWARQLGTSSSDSVLGVAVDSGNNVLIAGHTEGSLFGPHQFGEDAFVAKLAPDGSPVWAYQHGTSSWDSVTAVAVDGGDHVLIAGYTHGSLFGPNQGQRDAFVAKLAPDGSQVWAYQHGTSAWDSVTAVAVDGGNHVLIAGYTAGSLFGPHQGGFDAFVAKLAPDGSQVWAYQHGTSAYDEITAVAVDGGGHVLIAGYTDGSLFGPNQGNRDAFVAKLAPDGSQVWAYQHGTSVNDEITAVAVDGGNHVLIAGWTDGSLFGPSQGIYDAFVAKLAPDGSPVWAHQYGTSSRDEITAVAVDGGNHVLIVGPTRGSLFGPNQGNYDAFVAKLAPGGSPVWAYQHGTSEQDGITAVAVDGGDHVLIAGYTYGSLFGPNQGSADAFVAKLAP